MASIQTGIELQDNFSSVLYSIIGAVNMSVSAMEDMQSTMNADIDTSSLEGVRNEINQATIALDEMNQAMENMDVSAANITAPTVDVPQVDMPDTVINTDQPIQQSEPVTLPVIPEYESTRAPPDPVEVPVTWNTKGLDVFTGSGIERFEQEVQSTNNMLNTLNSTQAQIQQTASTMDILPDAAVSDINTMGQRLQMVQSRIQAIENNPVNMGTDQANNELEQLRSQLNQAIQEQNNLNQAMENMDVSAANDAYLRLSQTVSNTERYVRDNTDEQGQFNQAIQQGTNQADDLMQTIKGAVAAYISIRSVTSALDISDELTMTTARLNMMNDGLQSTQELTNMVYAAAQDARGSFSDMAGVVAKFGNNAKDAFSSSTEVVAFADLVQKQMTIAGASTTEASNAMLQLSQALGSGVLRGDELNSIFEQAPNLIQSIADYLDVPIGQIREMAKEGELSAETVKAAIFASSDEINSKFEEMPMTWGQIWQSMQNTAMIAFQPVLQRLNDIANSEAFQTFVNGAIEAMAILANIVLNIFEMVATVGSFIADNWSIISPIVYGVIAALAAYIAISAIVAAVNGIMAASTAIHAAAEMMATGATFAQTAAQYGLNAALAACPITWIIIMIIALIAIIFAVCNAIADLTGVATSGFGVICGAVATAGAFIGNIVIGLINTIIGIGIELYNLIATFANFFANVFNDPVGAIISLFSGMFDFILGIVQSAAKLIDTVLGTDMSGAVAGFRNTVANAVDDIVGDQVEVMTKLDASDYQLDRLDYSDSFDAGASWGDGVADAVSNFSLSDVLGSTELPSVGDYTSGFDSAIANSGVGDGVGSIADDTSAIKDSMDITEEDLKYLRDIAEQEAVNRYTTAEITIEQTNNNNISSDMDLDGVVNGLTDAVNEAVDVVTGRGD